MEKIKIPVYNFGGEKTGEVDLPENIASVNISIPVMHEVVTAYRNNQRQGTASTKTRAEVRGGGAKPWRQKGTGRARAGSTRSPLWRKGGITFGPRPRSYRQDLPKKKIKLAFKMAIKSKYDDNQLMVMNDFVLDAPKTKKINQLLGKLGLGNGKNVTLVIEKNDRNLLLAARNMQNFEVININSLNTYDVLKSSRIIFTDSSFKRINQ